MLAMHPQWFHSVVLFFEDPSSLGIRSKMQAAPGPNGQCCQLPAMAFLQLSKADSPEESIG